MPKFFCAKQTPALTIMCLILCITAFKCLRLTCNLILIYSQKKQNLISKMDVLLGQSHHTKKANISFCSSFNDSSFIYSSFNVLSFIDLSFIDSSFNVSRFNVSRFNVSRWKESKI
ncbi:MAG: hypothetical protein LBF22_03520 [Deltaproteobacteria bacterium]|nr:hypothetical protein [Deltaproteobacteria bacterium]